MEEKKTKAPIVEALKNAYEKQSYHFHIPGHARGEGVYKPFRELIGDKFFQCDMTDEFETLDKIAAIRPDTVRIYPVVILDGTKLGELYKSGEYSTFSFDEVTEFAAAAMLRFEANDIKVIKCGLHASEFVERDMVGGFYHPAFRELCESNIYRRKMEELIGYETESGFNFVFAVNSTCISKAMGHKKSNVEYFKNQGINIKIIGDENILKYEVKRR